MNRASTPSADEKTRAEDRSNDRWRGLPDDRPNARALEAEGHMMEITPSPQVSVIIPTYGHRDWVVATLQSVLAQTYRDFEIVVINDGSPDDTGTLLKPYADDGRIRYFEKVNAGQSAARNFGLSLARGEFIAFLDDDDLWPEDKLAWQVAVLRHDSSIGVIAGTARFIDSGGEYLHVTPFVAELDFVSIFRHCPITSPGQTLIRRSLIDKVGGLDESVAGVDDWDLWFKLAATTRFVMNDRIALLYRRHAGNASNNVARLYAGATVVATRHAGSLADRQLRNASRRAAFHSLHTDTGWGAVFSGDFKKDVKAGRWKAATANLGRLVTMWVGMGWRGLPLTALKDLAPERLRLMFGRHPRSRAS